ncbi:hypothetical protein T265_06028 [Opisthorchis viverrini]|uniref:Uncharacterized protein n=1 Tax=Opisthorchis viverrini TaxID=6198 RepID=A0A074ZHR6_OPIVI|nr:hypothetical protein T265_06028 [Opisthorchis viverrini]KER26823.1 hypothetical protein T265_06028 [Opisthorchis viverrini]
MPVANGASRTRQNFQVIAIYAIYTKRCTIALDLVLGINRPCAPLVVVLTTSTCFVSVTRPNHLPIIFSHKQTFICLTEHIVSKIARAQLHDNTKITAIPRTGHRRY